VQAAVAGDPRFVVDTLELERPGPSFMVETVRSLRDRYPEAELFLILGADQYAAFASWRAPQELAALVRLAVMDREGESARGLRPPLPGLGETVFVPVRRVDVSSTGVRDRIRRGEDVSGQLPRDVEAVIERLGLFRG
jgi:nicotinate-nucleotide adenylyltransferase